MSFTVSFGVINKKENSTSNSYSESLSASCLLKDGTDILRPTFSLQLASGFPVTCNYMYVSGFGSRYYWITGINFDRGVWYISGEVDVLATYKSAIGSTTAYVIRAASDYNQYIPDLLFPFESNVDVTSQYESIGLDPTGTVIITCAGKGDGTDSECYYAVYPTAWNRIYSKIFTSGFLSDYKQAWLDVVVDEFTNQMLRPSDYISSAIWVPVPYASVVGTRVRVITLGFSSAGAGGKAIDPGTLLYSDYKTVTLPAHMQYPTYGKWINGNTGRKIELYLPGYGSTVLDSDAAIDMNSVTISYGVDCSGVIHYDVIQGGYLHSYFSANISTPVGFTESRANVTGAVSGLVGGVAQAAMGNFLGGAATIGSALSNAAPKVERMVQGGSRALVAISPYIMVSVTNYQLPAGIDFTSTGRPLGKTKLISTLSGYVQCHSSASVTCSGTKEEIDQINNYLRSGFYYE